MKWLALAVLLLAAPAVAAAAESLPAPKAAPQQPTAADWERQVLIVRKQRDQCDLQAADQEADVLALREAMAKAQARIGELEKKKK